MEEVKEVSIENNKIKKRDIVRKIVIIQIVILLILGSYLLYIGTFGKPKLNIDIRGNYIAEGIRVKEDTYYEPPEGMGYSSLYIFNLTIKMTTALFDQRSINVGSYHFYLKCESRNVGLEGIHLIHSRDNDINLLDLNHHMKGGETISATMVFPYYDDMVPLALGIHSPNYKDEIIL